MNDIEVSSIDLVEGGNVFKQGHYLTLGYVPRDENGNAVDLSGKTITVALWERDGIAFESAATYSGGVLRFTLNETVPAGNYQIEFTATTSTDAKYRKKFPTNYNSGRISVQQSADDAGNLGISVYTVAQIKSEQQAAQVAYQEVIDPKITTLTKRVDDGVGAFTEDTEVIDARMGKSNLRQFNEGLTAQLAEEQGKTEGYLSVKHYESLKVAISGGYDWSPAINKAISEAAGTRKVVVLPQGITKIANPINIPNNGKLKGFGKAISLLETTGSFPAIVINGGAVSGVYNWQVSDLTLNGAGIGAKGIEVNYAREGEIKNVHVTGFEKGITFNQSWSNSITSSKIVSNSDKNLELGDQSNDFIATDCQFDNGGNYGIHLTSDSQMVSFIGCVIQNCGKEGVLIDAGRSINFTGCYFEKNNVSGTLGVSSFRASGSVLTVLGLNFSGSQFWDNKTSSSISLGRVQGVSITGSSFNPIGGGVTAYTIETASNTLNVAIIGTYKEKPYNDLGNCITSIASGDTTNLSHNIQVRKNLPTLTLNSTTNSEALLRFSQADVLQTELRQEINGELKMRKLNTATSQMEDIFRLPNNNLWYQLYKPLNMGGLRIQGVSNLLMSPLVNAESLNNSIFIDSSDNKLKFKDSAGLVKTITMS